jgi:uncharacterized protein YjbJ (UPF0337 family)
MGRESTKVKPEGAVEMAMGHVKDAAGSPSGNKALKTAGEADQAKGPSRRVLQKPTELVANKPVLQDRGTMSCTFIASSERGCVRAIRSRGLASFFLRPTKKGEEKTHDGCRQGR